MCCVFAVFAFTKRGKNRLLPFRFYEDGIEPAHNSDDVRWPIERDEMVSE